MSEKKQFDDLLGGLEKLPENAHILKLVSARASEMAAMTHSLENPQQTKLIFQKLPVHMRRRVMSHNAKRMPRRLRIGHISQMKKSGLPPKTKRPSRKYRRRPQNLLLEYNRRKMNKFWLETHIWHAKRFKMTEIWDFKLPNYSNDRCFRANYRAVMNHCLIQDISYYTCIEINGPMEILKQKLDMHCNPNELTFCAKAYINGQREGMVMFYKRNSYPYNPLGYVHFLWKSSDSKTKTIWIWLHPAFYSNVLSEIMHNFSFNLKENNDSLNTECTKNVETSTHKKYLTWSSFTLFLTNKIPIFINDCECQLTILRNCLNRFRLIGPLSISVLTDAFKFPNVDSNFNAEKVDEMCVDTKESLEKMDFENNESLCEIDIENNEQCKESTDTWYKIYYQSQENLEILKTQKDVFDSLRSLKSPNQLPPNMVLAATVLDPRFFLPQKRTKSTSNSETVEQILKPAVLANISPLWDFNILNCVTKNFIPTSAINNLRSQSLVPGVYNDKFYNEDIMRKIPILLIQKPGDYIHNNSIGFSSGIDIVFPAAWSMPFWLSLILRCAKAGGLRESHSIAYENSNLNVPAINHPDTLAYKKEADLKKNMLIKKYFRYPPNKRVNYIKFGITSPFYCEWSLLLKEWNNVNIKSNENNFYILRDRNILSTIREAINTNLKKRKKNSKDIDVNNLLVNLNNLISDSNCFIPVKVTSESKGLPKDFSIICIPTQSDLDKYKEDKSWSGPVDSIKPDPNEEKRRALKKAHIKKLNQCRRQRVRARKKMNYESLKIPLNSTFDVKHLNTLRQCVKRKFLNQDNTLVTRQAQLMEKLYLPKCTCVRNSCDREVIGYVTQGGFSFSEAKGIGLGYVILSSILNFVKERSNIVLTRNTTTRKYRICKLEILFN